MEDKSVAEILGINLDDQIVVAGYSFQASMPLIIYFSVIFLLLLLLFKIDTKGWSWLQYYNLLSTIPMFLPAVLNPIVPIFTINYYRHVLVSDLLCEFVYCAVQCFDELHSAGPGKSIVCAKTEQNNALYCAQIPTDQQICLSD
ncbi:hypothetical protein niasHS_009028 [Heterodera schachtii]|uniref:Uncharacterized protein n=1 Tax=Heterodera schachtii TaxID=97005 RepID=A0ABD2J333_HETSC